MKAFKIKATGAFKHGRKERNRPVSQFGESGVFVSTPRGKRNRYQESRNDRLRKLTYTPDKELRGKARTERNWFNDPREVFIG